MPGVETEGCPSDEALLDYLGGVDPGDVERHLEGCAECREVIAALAQTSLGMELPAPSAPSQSVSVGEYAPEGTRLGRYRIVGPLGAGGMGVVYRAHDDTLDRPVAIKVLRSSLAIESASRLVREARAMAALEHPNICPVFDLGRMGDRFFFAMQLVDGGTLQDWLRAEPRTIDSVVDAFAAAGRGLAAAHEIGVVHRDFKPHNVLIDDGGGVLVCDFGLAAGELDESLEQDPTSSDSASGRIVGTPHYMAPEQHLGTRATAASDQYSWCLSLWEALSEQPAFPGTDSLANKRAGAPATTNRKVPYSLARVLQRGLQPEPEARWPDMGSLLAAIERPKSAFVRIAGATLVASAAAVGVAWLWPGLGEIAPRCVDSAQQLDDVWSEAAKAELVDAFAAVGSPSASAAAEQAVKRIDEHARQWVAAHRDNCEATTVRAEQPLEVMDRRTACLSRARTELRATVDVLRRADRDAVRHAAELVDSLTPVAQCADLGALASEVEPPAQDEAAAVQRIFESLADIEVELEAGNYQRAYDLSLALEPRVGSVRYGPVRTALLLGRGQAQLSLAQYDASIATLEAALASAQDHGETVPMGNIARVLWEALARNRPDDVRVDHYRALAASVARRDPVLAVDFAATEALILQTQGRLHEAEPKYHVALAEMQRIRGPTDRRTLGLRNELGIVLQHLGRLDEAEVMLRDVISDYQTVFGHDHANTATATGNLGNLLLMMGRLDEAEQHQQRAMMMLESALGPEHRDTLAARANLATVKAERGQAVEAVAMLHDVLATAERTMGSDAEDTSRLRASLGLFLYDSGDYKAAEVELRRALLARERALGSDHPKVALSRGQLGLVLHGMGRLEEAESHYRRALEVYENAYGKDDIKCASMWINLGDLARARGDFDEAEAAARRAYEVRRTALGAAHIDTIIAHNAVATTIASQGKYEAAMRAYEEVHEEMVASMGHGFPMVAAVRHNLAAVLLHLEEPLQALPWAEAAWEVRRDDTSPEQRGRTALLLAQARWGAATDDEMRRGAVRLAKAALADFRSAGPGHAARAERVEHWLAEHPEP